MLNGEFESSKVIHRATPDFIPRPIGFGRFEAEMPATYFYLSEYVDMDVLTPPDPVEFTTRLAQLHRESQSPNGSFGFHVPTCDGDRAHVVEWEDSWAVFYRKLFLGVCELDIKRNGSWPEYERAIQQVAWAVIPRLLEDLLEEGRPIKPCIIHGDLWEGNMGIRRATNTSIMFDAGSFYGHNEMELSAWRCEYTSVFRAKEYFQAYLQHYPAAEPTDEFDDRNRLYSLKGAINYSAGHPGSELRNTSVHSPPTGPNVLVRTVSGFCSALNHGYAGLTITCASCARSMPHSKASPSTIPRLIRHSREQVSYHTGTRPSTSSDSPVTTGETGNAVGMDRATPMARSGESLLDI